MAARLQVTAPAGKEILKILSARGVPDFDIPTIKTKFYVDESLVRMEANIPNVISRPISERKQLTTLQHFMENPLRGSGTIAISSFPSDLKAKHLAVTMMTEAIRAKQYGGGKHGTGLPVWVRIIGSSHGRLVLPENETKPSLLVISNILSTSSGYKMERLRDLLEFYSDIPKIVVMGGEAPQTVFSTKIFYPLRGGIYLGPPNRVKTI